MLDGRIYRMSLIVPALALLVLAFSLTAQPGALHATLAPTPFDGAGVTSTMDALQARYPHRTAGSPADGRLATRVSSALAGDGFAVRSDEFEARTVHGERLLQNVIATRAGSTTGLGSIVVVAPRDAPGTAGVSGTALLMQLGRVLGGETLGRGLVLASVSGSAGAVGASRLAATLSGPVDAVIVLGDVASRPRGGPIVIPWSSGPAIAPARLRNTLAAALAAQSGIHAGSVHPLSQLAHLAFPLTLSQQGPFNARGLPAVELSLSGERGAGASAPVLSATRIGGIGEGVLAAVTALDSGPAMGAPSGDVLFDGELVPTWAISAFVLALIVPLLLVTIDGVARARRRRSLLGRSLIAVLTAAVPFLAAGIVLLIGHALGALRSPAGAVDPGAVPLRAGSIAVLAVALLAAGGGGVITRIAFAGLRRSSAERAAAPPERGPRTRPPARPQDGTAAALLVVLSVVAVLLWLANPFAAALLVPALHLWLWASDSDLALPGRTWTRSVMLLLGAVPTAAVVVFYAHSLDLGPGAVAYEAVLLLAGHIISWVAAIEWALVLGCLVAAVGLVAAAARAPEPEAAPVTVRGPLGYAGPGSLGGTKSALRR